MDEEDTSSAVPGPAKPPSRPASSSGRPRTQVEHGSLGSGRPPIPSDAATDPLPDLADAQWAALRQLADTPHAVVDRWPVGRAVAQSLLHQGLVDACSEWVWLTRSGLTALDARARKLSTPKHDTATPPTVERAALPTLPTAGTERGAQPTRPVRRPAGGELPPGVLLWAARASRP